MNEELKHVFFDLDHTLWDFDQNAKEALQELHVQYEMLKKWNIEAQDFITQYNIYNDQMWALYRKNKISKEDLRERRFTLSLATLGVPQDQLPLNIWADYLSICPNKTNLIKGAHEVCNSLYQKYSLHIITNGFKETQAIKLDTSGLGRYFKEVITSEAVGAKKPDAKIFNYALDLANATKINSIYIGDNLEADVIGGLNAGMKVMHFSPIGEQHQHEDLTTVSELKEILNHL